MGMGMGMGSEEDELVDDRSIQISIDRGGTFTDVYASWTTRRGRRNSDREELVIKLLSQDSGYQDAPIEGIRRVLESILKQTIPRNQSLNCQRIDYIRLSTTVATNALLERRGDQHALLITKGFEDLLEIGNQSRPRIFDLAIHKPSTLYSTVIPIDERVTLVDQPPTPHSYHRSIKGNSGEWVHIIKPLDQHAVRLQLERLKSLGFRSLAVVLMHSYTFPDHELQIAEIAHQLGFKHVSLSSRLMPMIKLVPRGTSSTADAYLTPILRDYLDGFYHGFDNSLTPSNDSSSSPSTRVEFMRSDGGLTDLENFSGLNSILSGPAAGVVGYALTTYDPHDRIPIIGLDMGGTSTDVSRFDGRYETVFESTTAGITLQSPQLDINTVAAGGGSRLFWRNGLFVTGPESAGASPGPACYRNGGPLAVTDANLILGRLIPRHFPKIFGPNQDRELDLEITRSKFHDLRLQINTDLHQDLSLDQVAWGFIKIANETMCRPIRALTEARGYDTSKHILSVFGGAGGQHACSIARTLNIKRIIIHKHSSVLSAYGLALADRVIESQQPSAVVYEPEGENRSQLEACLDRLEIDVRAQLNQQGFRDDRIRVERYLNLRYEGTDTALMILGGSGSTDPSRVDQAYHHREQNVAKGKGLFDYLKAFEESYRQEFGFLLDSKNLICDDVRVRAIGKSFDKLDDTITQQIERLEFKLITHEAVDDKHQQKTEEVDQPYESVYFEGHGRVHTRICQLDRFKTGDLLIGPALLIDQTQTIVIEPNVRVRFLRSHLVIDLD